MNTNLKFEQRAILSTLCVLAAVSSTKHEGHIRGMAYLMIQVAWESWTEVPHRAGTNGKPPIEMRHECVYQCIHYTYAYVYKYIIKPVIRQLYMDTYSSARASLAVMIGKHHSLYISNLPEHSAFYVLLEVLALAVKAWMFNNRFVLQFSFHYVLCLQLVTSPK